MAVVETARRPGIDKIMRALKKKNPKLKGDGLRAAAKVEWQRRNKDPLPKKTLRDLAKPHEPMVSRNAAKADIAPCSCAADGEPINLMRPRDTQYLAGATVISAPREPAPPANAPEILSQAAALIGTRGNERDQPGGERSMARCVASFNAMTGHTLTETDGWQFMELLKMARTRGGGFKLDDYLDGAAYCALAGESAQREASR